ncbi:hypothetical protein CK203_076744 [Vitis vinifera]|uniref:Uncharacterized protein n=1 Tax=Vitis vinifera TaxID=29760 RepID=A0A438EPI4_VITVI|nr:hypothetical protein CK203_076744 [Vitis vinifera]
MVSRIGLDLTLHFLHHRYRHRHRRFRLGCRLGNLYNWKYFNWCHQNSSDYFKKSD